MCEAAFVDTKTGQVLAQTKELFAMEQATGGGVAGVIAGAIIDSQRVWAKPTDVCLRTTPISFTGG